MTTLRRVAAVTSTIGVLLLSALWHTAGAPHIMCHPDVPDEATALPLASGFLHRTYGQDLTQYFGQRSAIPRLPFRATLNHNTWIVTNAVYARLA